MRIRIEYPENTIFSHDQRVRITDLNYGNHLGHDTLVSLLHETRARFFAKNDMLEGDIDGVGMILVDLVVSYRAQAFFGQVLRIEMSVGAKTSRGCDLVYRVTDSQSGALIALAKTGLLFFDYQENRVALMPPRFATII